MMGKWTGFIALVLATWIFSVGHAATRHAVATDTIVQAGAVHIDRSGDTSTHSALQELTAGEDWPDLDCQGEAIAPRASAHSTTACRLDQRTVVLTARSGRPQPMDRPPDLLTRSFAGA